MAWHDGYSELFSLKRAKKQDLIYLVDALMREILISLDHDPAAVEALLKELVDPRSVEEGECIPWHRRKMALLLREAQAREARWTRPKGTVPADSIV